MTFTQATQTPVTTEDEKCQLDPVSREISDFATCAHAQNDILHLKHLNKS